MPINAINHVTYAVVDKITDGFLGKYILYFSALST